jgi:hypothetical protein
LLDWRNLYDDTGDFDMQGKEIPYTKENAVKLLKIVPDLLGILMTEAKKLGNFRAAEVKEAAGKSLPPSEQF